MSRKPNRRRVSWMLAAAGLLAGAQAWAVYPDRPVRLIVPFPPGGASDQVGRALAQYLGQRLGQTVVVENRGGAGGAIGVAAAAQAAPDGYTLLLGMAESFGIAENLTPGQSTPAIRDFAPIALVTRIPSVFVVNNQVPAKTLMAFVKLAKSQPGRYHFGSPGTGTNVHLIGEMLKARYGLDIVHVPYKGGSPALTDLLGGQIEMMPSAVAAVAPRIKDGSLRALAVTSAGRSPMLPEVPTMAEAGVADFVVGGWFGVLARAGTPQEAVAKLEREVEAVTRMPEFKERMAAIGGEGNALAGRAFGDFIAAETARWRGIIKTAGIKAE